MKIFELVKIITCTCSICFFCMCCGDVTEEIPVDVLFINPALGFPSSNVVEPEEGYPHPYKQFPDDGSGEKSIEELNTFCSEIREMFNYPEMTKEEAEDIYLLLEDQFNFSDGSYGMPSPDAPEPAEYVVRERILLRKSKEGKVEIFYDKIGCGRRYTYAELNVDESSLIEIIIIEKWSERYPC